jgi:hypothetical protein
MKILAFADLLAFLKVNDLGSFQKNESTTSGLKYSAIQYDKKDSRNNFAQDFYTKSKSIKWVFTALTLFLLSSQLTFAQTPTNGGFETTISNGTDWTTVGSATTTSPRTGSKGLEHTTSSTSNVVHTNIQTISIASSSYAHVIGWAKGSNANSRASCGGTLNVTAGSGTITTIGTTLTRLTYSIQNSTAGSVNFSSRVNTRSVSGSTTLYWDDIIMYTSTASTPDLTKPVTATSFTNGTITSSSVGFSWTAGSDAATGIQNTIILRTTNLSAATPVMNDQGIYSTGGGTSGPNVVTTDWAVISTSVGASTLTYTDGTVTSGQSYKYAVIHRDLAYNYSSPLVSGTINVTSSISTVNLSINSATSTETSGSSSYFTLTATSSSAVSGAQTVDISLTGTGLTNGDFREDADGPGSGAPVVITFPYTLTIANGQTTASLQLVVIDDAVYECTENATFAISNTSVGITTGITTTQSLSITDNDFPTANLSINTTTGSETSLTSITLTATASTSVIGTQTVSVSLTGTGLTNTDFSGTTFPATITIANGSTTGTATFAIIDDSSIEGDESATFTISSPSSCVSLGATTTQGLTIVENDFPTAPCSELFISEYVEGNGNNKYIEIYNPTSSSINLGTYTLRVYNNGNSSPDSDIALSGTIAAYGTVVYKNSAASIYGGTSTSNAAVSFNGDDAVALAKSGVNIDIFGRIGNDPGTSWTSGVFSTLDKTLVRNASVQVGIDVSPTGTGSGSFTTLSTEWTQSNIDVVSNLGSHTCDCFVSNPVVTLGINTTTGSEASSTSITLTATSDATVTGDQTVQVTLSGTGVANADFSSVTFPTNITILNGSTTGTITFTINNDVAVEGDETATFTIGTPSSGVTIGTTITHNLTIADDDNVTSTESVITSVGGEVVTISSLTNGTITTSTQGTQVWQFRLYDGNGSGSDVDTKPTIYEQWVIRPSAGNTVPDWSSTLNNIKFFQDASGTPIPGSFVLNSASISFIPTTAIAVSDNGFVLISIRVTLDNPLVSNSDGLNFGFRLVPADVTVETDVLLSSQLGSFTSTSNGSLNVIDIDATLQFISAPTTVGLGDVFTITISAIDANGNIDQDDNSLITLVQNTGTGNLTGESVNNLANGTYTWNSLSYDTEETFQVIASGGGYIPITANINVVDEEFQLFDHFNRADGNSLGIPSSGGGTSWTEMEAGDGTKVRIFGNMLMLDNCISSDPIGSSGSTTTERVTFNAETYFETIFDNAGTTMNWMFNMRTNNSNLSGFASSAYGMAFVLGSNQDNFTAAGSDGYAVVIGNSGATDNIKLVKFTNGLNSDANVTDIVASNIDINADHASVKVSFDPCSGEWTLYVRNDGPSFVAPNVTTPAFSGPFTATNTDHSDLDLKHFGALWKHNSSCVGNDAYFDNFYIPNSGSVTTTAKVWNGSVNANWNEPNNWEPCPGIPTNTDDVIIANVTTQPIISVTPAATCKNLTVNVGSDLTINSGQFLNVQGNVTNNGNTNFGAGTLVMEGLATLTLDGSVNVANFHVSTNVTLNGVVTVTSIARSETGGALTTNGNLILQSGSQLLHGTGTTNGGGTVSGNIVVRRQGASSSTVYNYWSTPVVGGTLPGSYGYLYNSLSGTHDYSDDTNPDPGWQPFGGSMTNGRGYASTAGGLASFTGVANDATITYGVTTSTNIMSSLSPGTRFNLLGNPYPSAISANGFINVNGPSGTGRIAGVIYFWDDDFSGGSGYTTGDYGVWSTVGSVGGGGNTPNGFISTGQGFHVDAISSGNITFTNAMRGGTNSQFFRLVEEDQMDRIWLSLSGNNLFNQTLVVFKDDATDLSDVMYDAHKVRGNTRIALGSMQANEPFAIAAFPSIVQPRPVPLQTYVAEAGTYTFKVDSLDGFNDIDVYLQDLQSGQLYLLNQGTTVNAQLTNQDALNRFQLWFSPELVTGIEDESSEVYRIVYVDRGIQVQMSNEINTIGQMKVYNTMGQIILVKQIQVVNGKSTLVDLSSLPMGLYSVEFVSPKGSTSGKFAHQ